MQPFQLFMLKEHIKNLQNEITEYKKSMDDDFAFEEENGEQKGGPKTSKVDQKLARPFCNLYPRTQVSLRAKWPTD